MRSYEKINPLVDWDACGSGIIIDKRGIIATNNHVVKDAKKVVVKIILDSLKVININAEILSSNLQSDIAILRIIDSTNTLGYEFENISFNNSIEMGQDVFTLGFPNPAKLGENQKLNKGIVSANLALDNPCYFQTDLPVWFGNSGGPCFNKYGELIGLVSAIIFDKNHKVENVSYVVKSSCILDELSKIKIEPFNQVKSSKNVELQNLVKKLSPNAVFIKVYY